MTALPPPAVCLPHDPQVPNPVPVSPLAPQQQTGPLSACSNRSTAACDPSLTADTQQCTRYPNAHQAHTAPIPQQLHFHSCWAPQSLDAVHHSATCIQSHMFHSSACFIAALHAPICTSPPHPCHPSMTPMHLTTIHGTILASASCHYPDRYHASVHGTIHGVPTHLASIRCIHPHQHRSCRCHSLSSLQHSRNMLHHNHNMSHHNRNTLHRNHSTFPLSHSMLLPNRNTLLLNHRHQWWQLPPSMWQHLQSPTLQRSPPTWPQRPPMWQLLLQ